MSAVTVCCEYFGSVFTNGKYLCQFQSKPNTIWDMYLPNKHDWALPFDVWVLDALVVHVRRSMNIKSIMSVPKIEMGNEIWLAM